MYSSFCVKEALHGIELAKVKSENFQIRSFMGLGLDVLCQKFLVTTRNHGLRSTKLIQMAIAPNLDLTWILFGTK